MTAPRPVTVAVVNDFEIVVRGVRAMLAPYAHRVKVVELEPGGPASEEVDVRLYDTFSEPQVHGEDLQSVLADPGAVVVYTWNLRPRLVETALGMGCRGYLVKGTPAENLVDALERVAAGEVVTSTGTEGEHDDTDDDLQGAWPGQGEGLSARESEIISLICRGLTNQDIATRTYLSINSVKTYIRTAYRKMGVTRRSQAVRWGMERGLAKEAPGGRGGDGVLLPEDRLPRDPVGI